MDSRDNHTPGAWHPFIMGDTVAVMDDEGREIIQWTGFDGATADGATSLPRQRANARLIAAAPDLLRALQNIINGIETGAVRIETEQDETWSNAFYQAQQAITRAKETT